MNVVLQANAVSVTLEEREAWVFKSKVLNSTPSFKWRILPPFPFGSPIARVIHGCYFGMKEVKGDSKRLTVRIVGWHPRGNFFALTIPPKEKVYVNAHLLVGFTMSFRSLHTHIRLWPPVFWCLHRLFFPVFEGPGTVLLYSGSPLEETDRNDLQPETVVAFNINRTFIAAPPMPWGRLSEIMNVFSRMVLWRLQKAGTCVVENVNHEDDSEPESFWGHVKHVLLYVLEFFRL